jgi:hypothetical protein
MVYWMRKRVTGALSFRRGVSSRAPSLISPMPKVRPLIRQDPMIGPLIWKGLADIAPLLGFSLVPRNFVPRNPHPAYAAG